MKKIKFNRKRKLDKKQGGFTKDYIGIFINDKNDIVINTAKDIDELKQLIQMNIDINEYFNKKKSLYDKLNASYDNIGKHINELEELSKMINIPFLLKPLIEEINKLKGTLNNEFVEKRYFEKQEEQLCGKHAINNLFGCQLLQNLPRLSDVEFIVGTPDNISFNLAFICKNKKSLGFDDFDCDIEIGYYSAEFMSHLFNKLKEYNIIGGVDGPIILTKDRLYNGFKSTIVYDDNMIGYILLLNREGTKAGHWISIQLTNNCPEKLLLLDSLKNEPICLTDEVMKEILEDVNQLTIYKIYKKMNNSSVKIEDITENANQQLYNEKQKLLEENKDVIPITTNEPILEEMQGGERIKFKRKRY